MEIETKRKRCPYTFPRFDLRIMYTTEKKRKRVAHVIFEFQCNIRGGGGEYLFLKVANS
jgi:hypothetical protein